MHQILFNMQPSCDQAFVYILIGKACHCMDVRVCIHSYKNDTKIKFKLWVKKTGLYVASDDMSYN